ncbi:DM DNA-binding domain [Trinorchestia longiramus]|nr:DM DNA-binding domain [Trinorchestia longiramus]
MTIAVTLPVCVDISEGRDQYPSASSCMAKIMRAAGREPPAQPAQKRRQHCTFCKNHGIIKRKNGHVCDHKDCDCLLCQLTTQAQVAMRYQQALWRHQGREMAKNKNFTMLGVSSRQLCDKCRNHNKFFKKRGHKSECEFENCKCPLCQLTDKRRLVMKHQQRVRRANVTSRVISSDEEDVDESKSGCRQDDQTAKNNDRDSDDHEENMYEEGTNEHAIVGALKQVTQAMDALPSHMRLISSTGSVPRRSKKNPRISAPLKRSSLKAEFSPPRESHNSVAPASISQYSPIDTAQPATVTHSSTRRPELGLRPWDCDRESPPVTVASYPVAKYSPRTPTPNKASPPVYEAKATIKQEVKDEDTWPNVVSSEQNPINHSFAPPPPPPPGSMLLPPPSSSYLNNMPSFYPLASQPKETCVASPPMFSPPRDGTVPSIFNSARSLYRKSPRTDFIMAKAFDSCKIHAMDDIRDNVHPFESDISAADRSDYMYGKLLTRGNLGPSNNMPNGQGASSLAHFAPAPHSALESLSFFTKMKLPRQFPEHFARGPDQSYSTHQSSANHPPIPQPLAASSQTAMDAAAALHNPIQPCPLRWFPPLSYLPYQSPFSLMQSDPFLRYPPMLFPRTNRNS